MRLSDSRPPAEGSEAGKAVEMSICRRRLQATPTATESATIFASLPIISSLTAENLSLVEAKEGVNSLLYHCHSLEGMLQAYLVNRGSSKDLSQCEQQVACRWEQWLEEATSRCRKRVVREQRVYAVQSANDAA